MIIEFKYNIQPHEERLFRELEPLQAKVWALFTYLQDKPASEATDLMQEQLTAMRAYEAVLKLRCDKVLLTQAYKNVYTEVSNFS